MKTNIYYFSTTGNSLLMARRIAEGLGEAELISIPKTKDGLIDVSAQRVGFVFPVYAWGPPKNVREFINKLHFYSRPYVFAVATCGGTPAKALLQLKKLLIKAGADLDAAFAVKEGANMVTKTPGIALFVSGINKKKCHSGMERLPEILDAIKNNRKHEPETSSPAANFFGELFNNMGQSLADKMGVADANFSVDERCIGCHTCKRVCPNENIEIVVNKPVWQHKCRLCNACIQWCPQQAIHFKDEVRRYRNPNINVEDMILR
ncbi:MAG: EFR1 family ferrodoxin [Bacillota bacterium]